MDFIPWIVVNGPNDANKWEYITGHKQDFRGSRIKRHRGHGNLTLFHSDAKC